METPEVIYYDRFADTYCLTTETIEPPERYLPTYRGVDDGIYIETYGNNGYMLDIAYSKAAKENGLVEHIRFSVAERHGFDLKSAVLIKWVIPNDLYDKYVEEYCTE